MDVIEVSLQDIKVHQLINQLDQYQIDLYGLECCYLDSIDDLIKSDAYMIGAYSDNTLVGIGAVKLIKNYAEIKRMYFCEAHRGSGLASKLLKELELYVQQQSITKIFLETGYLQLAAIAFYKKQGYSEVQCFGNYTADGISVFLGKTINLNNCI